MEQERLRALFDKQATMYDQRRRKNAFDTKWRKKLLAQAKGQVLEVAVGAGVNFQFYEQAVENVTAVDLSPAMLEKAKQAADENGINAQFIAAAIEELTFAADSFDTIVSTLGLCAYSNPVEILNRFSMWCKKGGQILLLEHGISSSRPIAWVQNKMDRWHEKKMGCHLNRDILQIVSESDVVMQQREGHYMDVFHLIWATPGEKAV